MSHKLNKLCFSVIQMDLKFTCGLETFFAANNRTPSEFESLEFLLTSLTESLEINI